MSDEDWFRDNIASWTNTDGQPWDRDKWGPMPGPGQPIQPSRIIEGEPTPLRVVPDTRYAPVEPPQAPVGAARRVNPLPAPIERVPPQPVERSRGLRLVLQDLLDALKGPKQ